MQFLIISTIEGRTISGFIYRVEGMYQSVEKIPTSL